MHTPLCSAVLLLALLTACGDTTPSGAASSSTPASAATTARPKPSAAASATATATAATTASATPSASAAPAVPPPYDGKLTVAQVMYGGTLVHPFDAWDDAMKTLEPVVGKATETHDAYSCCAAKEGDQCAYFCVEKTTFEKLKRDKKGPAVGATDNPQTFGPDGPSGNVEACNRYLGKGAAKK